MDSRQRDGLSPIPTVHRQRLGILSRAVVALGRSRCPGQPSIPFVPEQLNQKLKQTSRRGCPVQALLGRDGSQIQQEPERYVAAMRRRRKVHQRGWPALEFTTEFGCPILATCVCRKGGRPQTSAARFSAGNKRSNLLRESCRDGARTIKEGAAFLTIVFLRAAILN
jgi:hypothetical protein